MTTAEDEGKSVAGEQEHQAKKHVGSCCARLLAEWRLDMFSTTDVNGRIIDLDACFHPVSKEVVAYVLKASFFAWSIQVIVDDLVRYDVPGFWIAYLTHWGTSLTSVYFALTSLLCILRPISQDPAANCLTRFTWLTFTTTVSLEVVIALLFWTLDYDGGGVSYQNIMQHGILMLAVMFDGFIINRIPIRFKQSIAFFVVAILYLIWSGIQAITGMGNPQVSDMDPSTDDDAIYRTINWNERPGTAVVVSIVVQLVVIPVAFLFVWSLSTCGRRYLPPSPHDEEQPTNDIEAPAARTEQAGNGDKTSENYQLNSPGSEASFVQ